MTTLPRVDIYRLALNTMRVEGRQEFYAAAQWYRERGVNVFDLASVFGHTPDDDDMDRLIEELLHGAPKRGGKERRYIAIIGEFTVLKVNADPGCCGSGYHYLARDEDRLFLRCSFCDAAFDVKRNRIERPANELFASRPYLASRFNGMSDADWFELNFPEIAK